MATLKESFAKGITALNVKTNNFIEENKCKTYISTLEEEIIMQIINFVVNVENH